MGCCDSTPAVAPSEIAEGTDAEPLMRPFSIVSDNSDSCQKASISSVVAAAFGKKLMDEASVDIDKGHTEPASCKPSAATSSTPRLPLSGNACPPLPPRSTPPVSPAVAPNSCKGRCNGQDVWDSTETARSMDVDSTASTRGVAPRPRVPTELVRLQYREVTPEDYDLLLLLDEALPKRGTSSEQIVAQLPTVQASSKTDAANGATCQVCLSEMQTPANVVQLPCKHAFHKECISRWLTQCNGTCPVCKSTVSLGSVEGVTDVQK